MRYKLKCKTCLATCWVNGSYEPDTNATELDDSCVFEWEPENPGCEHEDYEIVDGEDRQLEDDIDPFSSYDGEE